MVRCQISANICHLFTSCLKPCSTLFQPFAFSFKQLSDLFYFCFISFQPLFNIFAFFAIRLSSDLQSVNFSSVFFCTKDSFAQKCTFGGWIWPATLLGWFCESYFLASLCSSFFVFSIIQFSWKWPSRMNKLYRKNPIFVQNRFNRFHHFSIGPTQLSNLLQPLAIFSINFQTICFSLVFGNYSAKIDCCRKYLDDVPK